MRVTSRTLLLLALAGIPLPTLDPQQAMLLDITRLPPPVAAHSRHAPFEEEKIA